MRLKTLLLLLGVTLVSISAALLMTGCQTPALDPIAERAYTQWRWIGRMQEDVSECPQVVGWAEARLFPRSRGKDADPGHYQAGLDRYCLYTTTNTKLRFPATLPADLAAAAPDRMAISTTSAGGRPVGALGQAAWPVWAQQFRAQALGTDSQKGGGIRLREGKESVRLVFLDTQETGKPFTPLPGSRHGYTLVHLARNLVCPTGEERPCAAKIETRHALLYDGFHPDQPLPTPSPGGHLGLLSHLAMAIRHEVSAWIGEGKPQHLILNLSLGWDGEPFGDLEAKDAADLAPPVQAVYGALRYARESGALVIAAAGNHRGGRDSTSPLLPAAWDLSRPGAPSRQGSLLYAVGGVDARGLHLANSRRSGRPERAAFADHAVTEGSDGLPTAIYTGTSVSAAVVSSIAAVVWHLRPELPQEELMQLITLAGNETASLADYYPQALTEAPRVRRLSLCFAVKLACAGAACSALEEAPRCAWERRPAEVVAPPAPPTLKAVTLPCNKPGSCPTEELPDQTSHRWVGPQPEDTPCSNCVLRPPPPESSYSYALYPEIDPDWIVNEEPLFESATLQIACGSKPAPKGDPYQIPAAAFVGKQPIGLDFLKPGDLLGCSAALSFKVKDLQLSVQSPVYVQP